MSTVGLNFKNWLPAFNGNLFQTDHTLAEQGNETYSEESLEASTPPKFPISVREMQTISNALIIYAKHLANKAQTEKAEQVQTLELRIFEYLNHLSQA